MSDIVERLRMRAKGLIWPIRCDIEEAADEIERLRAALLNLIAEIGGHGHWDAQGTHGANCPICERQFVAKEKARRALEQKS